MPDAKELDRKIAKARKARNSADDAVKELVDLHVPKAARTEKKVMLKELRRIRADQAERVEKLRDRKHDAKKDGAEEAYKWLKQFVGTTESPANSNKGPMPISPGQIFTIGYDGVPWCGCTVAITAIEHGGADIPYKARLAYTPYIDYDAGTDSNGLKEVNKSDARLGDFAVFNFGSGEAKHVGFVIEVVGSSVRCLEGNTSSGSSGSQDNGGGLYERTRPLTDVICMARPDYK